MKITDIIVENQQGVAEGSEKFTKITTSPADALHMLGGKHPVAFVIEVLCPDRSVVKIIRNKIDRDYMINRDDSILGNGIGIEIISPWFGGGRTAQDAYEQLSKIIEQSGGQFNNSTQVQIYRQKQAVAEGTDDFSRNVATFRVYQHLDPMEFYNMARTPQGLAMLAKKAGTTPESVKDSLERMDWGQFPDEFYQDPEDQEQEMM